ncbi:MAG: DUF3662 domain-containing protein [Chloroflexi bacterium]|nr:DUF3662 domain-containing protein [Chloroflexota bacterium]
MNPLSRFEDYIQRIVEGGFARLFAGRLHPRTVAVALARAMQDAAQQLEDGRQVAPDVYAVRLNTTDHAAVLAVSPHLDMSLSDEIVGMARAAGMTLLVEPYVRLIADENIPPQRLSVNAHHSQQPESGTQSMNVPQPDVELPNAYLVLEGVRHVPIERTLMNIGRHRDNHLIIDDPRVSRHHAQIRHRNGSYILLDVGSSGGTTVNGQRIRDAVLRPGDVISMAGYSMLYIEDRPDEPTNY